VNLTKLKFIGAAALVLLSTGLQADETDLRLFYSYELNGGDYISSIGTGVAYWQGDSNLGFQLNTSIGQASILADDGYIEEYVSWEGAVKFGYFSDISVYVEGGVDLAEILFHDLRYDDYDEEFGYQDDIDAYVGVGIGFKAGLLQVDGFIRAREIDSKYWEAESVTFTGMQVSINF